jgi:hypothetical protein
MMRLKGFNAVALFCALLFCGAVSLYGQANAEFLGTVTDQTGAVIPGATVTITAQQTGVTRTVKTDQGGRYLVPFLPVGVYTIKADLTGFTEAIQQNLALQVDEQREVDFTLQPATVSQKVEVSATAVAVQTSNSTLGQVITSQQVSELPLNGRDFVQLATLTAGTVQQTDPGSFFTSGGSSEVAIRGAFSLSVGGSRPNSTDWLLDGVDNNELTAGGIDVLPSIDAIQEFKVLTYNYSAEYGTRGGPTVLVTIKSGTNALHGDLFEFLRNTSLDSRSFFATSTPRFQENEFGGMLGGPIKKDKTFFFVDYQGRKYDEGEVFVGQMPTDLMKQGNFTQTFEDVNGGGPPPQLYNPYSSAGAPFYCNSSGIPLPTNPNGSQTPTAGSSPCNIIPSSLISPIGQKLVNMYPEPNNLAPNLLSEDYINQPGRTLKEGEGDVKLDHNFSSKDSMWARFSYDQATLFDPGGAPGYVEQGAFASSEGLADHTRNAGLGETHVFSPTALNKITLGYSRDFNHILSIANGTCESAILGIPNADLDCTPDVGLNATCPSGSVSCGMSSIDMTGGWWALGDRGYSPFVGGSQTYFLSDSADVIRGKHDITFGGEFRDNQLNVLTNAFQDGFYVFAGAFTGNPLADLLLGFPVYGEHDQTFQGATTGRRWKLFRPFIQDDWRATSKLTLNLGLGWAFVTPTTEAFNRQANFNYATGQWLIAGQSGGSTVGISTDARDAEPRIGLAWTPFSDRKTVFRAGYGIFHDSSWNQGAQGLWENPPYFGASFVPFGNNISQGFPLLTEPTSVSQFAGLNLNSMDLSFKPGMIQQYNFNIQRGLPGDWLLTVGYAGSRSTHLTEGQQDINIQSPTACGVVSGYTLGCGRPTEPYPQYGAIYDNFDNGSVTYNSVQVKLETKSSKHGLYALIGYTYSKSQDNGMSDGLGSNIGAMYYNLPGITDEGLSQIDLTHEFTASILYDLPFGKGRRFGNKWSAVPNAILGGWRANLIEHAISGFPMYLVSTTGGTNSGVGFSNDGNDYSRPNRVCNGQLSNWSVSDFFNASCFVDPPSGELGNSSRTPLFGPPLVNTDFSLVKDIPLSLREGAALRFRAEFFNLFNHPQFQPPQDGTVNIDVPAPAELTGTVNNPRLIQFALKLIF